MKKKTPPKPMAKQSSAKPAATIKPKVVTEADRKQAEQLKKSYNERMNTALKAEYIAKELKKQPKEKSYPKVVRYQSTNHGLAVSNNPSMYEKAAQRHRSLAKQDSIKAVGYDPSIFKKKK